MICLSFDTDHLDDDRMGELLAEVRIPGTGTFFCTQTYEALGGSGHELCPHPHLEPGADWDAELRAAREQFPDAPGIRLHRCLWSHQLALDASERGYRYSSSYDEIGRADLTPRREAWGIWHLPIYYMDNLDFSFSRHWSDVSHEPFDRSLLEAAVAGDGLYVFDFHPIHLLLNSSNADDYLDSRDAFLAGDPASELRGGGYGARDYYEDLLDLMSEAGVSSVAMSAAIG